jgi:HlyD family secretion protein
MRRLFMTAALAIAAATVAGCHHPVSDGHLIASGYVEATEIRVASKVAGRVATVTMSEGQRVKAGDVLVTLDTVETDLALRRARASRDQADAEWRLLRAGSRAEDVRQAAAQVAVAEAERRAADADLNAARADERRFEQLLQARSGSQKQRDDAVTRRELAEARLRGAGDKVQAATEQLGRLRAGARPEELDAARARISAADAQIATLDHDRAEATIVAPSDGVVTSRLVEPGELVGPRTPLLVVVDLDRAWANVYVEEPRVPAVTLDQPVTIVTDGGQRLLGRVGFISPQAEFTPRNVQTAEERAKLVFRVKVMVDNRSGVLKPGMPVEADFGPAKR